MKMKFRVWDNENNKYFVPTYKAYEYKVEDLLIVFGLNGRLAMRTIDDLIDESMFPGRFEIEWYTGRNDSKRTEEFPEGEMIFEGDEVEVFHEGINEDGSAVREVVVVKDIMAFRFRINEMWVDIGKIVGNVRDAKIQQKIYQDMYNQEEKDIDKTVAMLNKMAEEKHEYVGNK